MFLYAAVDQARTFNNCPLPSGEGILSIISVMISMLCSDDSIVFLSIPIDNASCIFDIAICIDIDAIAISIGDTPFLFYL